MFNMTFVRKQLKQTTIKVQLEPKVMEVVGAAIYDGVFLTSNQISEDYLAQRGFTQAGLTDYLIQLVSVRWGLVTSQLTAKQRAIAKQLYVPAGVAQMLTCIGNVQVGNYQIELRDLTDQELAAINWTQLQNFSDVLLELERLCASVKYILMPKVEGDRDTMAMMIDRVDARDCEISAHAQADVENLHPVKQAFALMAGLKLVEEERFGILYPIQSRVDGFRTHIYGALSEKVDR